MSRVAFEMVQGFAAVFAVGLAVKLLDDHLDQEEDAVRVRSNLAQILGRGSMAYGLFCYALGAWLRPAWSFTLFLASYACGMLGTVSWLLPSRLPAWLEAVATLALGLGLAGWQEMVSSGAFILGVQLLDDIVDMNQDAYLRTRPNLARRWGKVEAALAGTAVLVLGLILAPLKTLLALAALPLVLYLAAAPWAKEGV